MLSGYDVTTSACHKDGGSGCGGGAICDGDSLSHGMLPSMVLLLLLLLLLFLLMLMMMMIMMMRLVVWWRG